jgi:hypothetical protein
LATIGKNKEENIKKINDFVINYKQIGIFIHASDFLVGE